MFNVLTLEGLKVQAECPRCGKTLEEHKAEAVTLDADLVSFTTTGGTFIDFKCPPRLELVK